MEDNIFENEKLDQRAKMLSKYWERSVYNLRYQRKYCKENCKGK